MTSRTPQPHQYTNFGRDPNKRLAENINTPLDNNGTNANKASNNQSKPSGNNGNTTTENTPVNTVYRSIPTNNYSALFDIEYIHVPYVKKKENIQEKKSDDANGTLDKQNKREINTGDKNNSAGVKRDNDYSEMAYEGYRVDQLEQRNKQHSAKIHLLENELRKVKLENDVIKEHFSEQDGPHSNNGYSDREARYDRDPARYDERPDREAHYDRGPARYDERPEPKFSDAYGRPQDHGAPGQPPGRPQYKNEQHRLGYRDEETYWGFNKIYDPQFLTAYRREHIPYYAKMAEKEKEEEWRRKRQEEEARLMMDKPKTYEYTTPYLSEHPPRDINKYFHDSKYINPVVEDKPDEYYFGAHAPFKANPGTGISTYERAYTSPRYGYMQEQIAGGLYIIRFADSGYDDVLVALRQLQPILKSNRGHILGIARKQHVYPLEGDPEWWFSKDQHHRHPKIRVPYKSVEEAVAVFWFPYKEKAKAFYDNSFHNRFRDHNFPTTRSYEGHYIPLLTPPILRDLNTYLVIELLNGKRYHPEDIQNFQARANDTVLKRSNNCLPFVASALEGRESFKPGALFDPRSKVFISRFDSMVELSELWMTETIQNELMRNGLSGPRNVWAFSLMDWED